MSTILVVDDDRDSIEYARLTLERHKHRIISAMDGKEGYSRAKSDHPDLILLDVMMTHDTEGFETVRSLKEDETTKCIPIIIMTGIRKAKELPFSFEPDDDWLPVNAILEKPIPPGDLVQAVEAAIQ